MANTQNAYENDSGVRIEYEESGKVKVLEIHNIDELVRYRLSSVLRPRVSLISARRLARGSKISGETLRWMTTKLPRELVADSLEINPTNLSKLYRRKALSRTQTEGLEDLTHLWKDVLQDLFHGDEAMMKRWLETPVPALGGETPKGLMGSLSGRKVVEQYVEKLKYGDYS